jgi:hypothetical protein
VALKQILKRVVVCIQCGTVLEKPAYKTTKKQKCTTMKEHCKNEDKFMTKYENLKYPQLKLIDKATSRTYSSFDNEL